MARGEVNETNPGKDEKAQPRGHLLVNGINGKLPVVVDLPLSVCPSQDTETPGKTIISG